MSISHRTFVAAPRLRLVSARSIAPLSRFFSSEAAAPAPTAASESTAPAVETPATETPATATPLATPKIKPSTSTYKARTKTAFPSKAATVPKTAAASASSTAPAGAAKVAPTSKNILQPVPPKFEWRPRVAPASKATKSNPDDINWEKSFHGLGTQPVTEVQFKILTQPIDLYDIQVKPDGIIYLPEIKYRRRLNEAFGPMGWGIVPRGDTVVGKEIVTREYALIINGCFVSQALGVNNYFNPEGIPQAVEGAKSNALMRCCKDLGIASELWDPNFIRWFNKNFIASEWVEHAVTKKKRVHYYKKGEAPEVAYPWKLT